MWACRASPITRASKFTLDALKLVREKLKLLEQEIDAWESLTRSTDYA